MSSLDDRDVIAELKLDQSTTRASNFGIRDVISTSGRLARCADS